MESLATPSEERSPFYIKNKETCEQWRAYILERAGEVKAKYSAWALKLRGYVDHGGRKWTFDIEKSTMTNHSLYFILINRKDVHERTHFSAGGFRAIPHSFTYRKKKWLDSVWRRPVVQFHYWGAKFVYEGDKNEGEAFCDLIRILQRLKGIEHLESIHYNQEEGKLSIKFRTIIEDWERIDQLIEWLSSPTLS